MTPECRKERLQKADGRSEHFSCVWWGWWRSVPAQQQTLQGRDLGLQLCHRLVVQDAAGRRRSLRESHTSDTHAHTCTVEVRSGAKSQHALFKRSPEAPLQRHEIIKKCSVKERKHAACKVNKYSQCKCQKPHVFVSQIIRHHNNCTTAGRRRCRTSGRRRPTGHCGRPHSGCFYIIFLTIEERSGQCPVFWIMTWWWTMDTFMKADCCLAVCIVLFVFYQKPRVIGHTGAA